MTSINRNGIKLKLLIAFGTVIVIWLTQMIYFASLHIKIVEQYKTVTDNLVLENNLSSLTPELIQAYYNTINSPGNNDRIHLYNELHQQIKNTFSELDKDIIDKENRVAFNGLRNYLMNIMATCDTGIAEMKDGKIIESVRRYDEIIAKSKFIDENVGNLVAKELNYAGTLQVEIGKKHHQILQQGAGIVLAITIFCITFAIFLANKVVTPLSHLSEVSNKISNGHLKVRVNKNLLNQKNEIGALSRSIENMLKRLNQEIDTQKKVAKNLEKSRIQLEKSNNTLEKFNKIAIGRELKMIKMKKEIETLKSAPPKKPSPKKKKK